MENKQDFHTVRGYQLLNKENRLLTPAMEDYLEMIYRKSMQQGYIRINALSEFLNVAPSSSTKMVQKLARLRLLDYRKYGIVMLTEKGRDLGEFLLQRHNIIERFLETIGIDGSILAETELIEHNVGKNTLQRIDILNRFFENNPDVLHRLKDYFKAFGTNTDEE